MKIERLLWAILISALITILVGALLSMALTFTPLLYFAMGILFVASVYFFYKDLPS